MHLQPHTEPKRIRMGHSSPPLKYKQSSRAPQIKEPPMVTNCSPCSSPSHLMGGCPERGIFSPLRMAPPSTDAVPTPKGKPLPGSSRCNPGAQRHQQSLDGPCSCLQAPTLVIFRSQSRESAHTPKMLPAHSTPIHLAWQENSVCVCAGGGGMGDPPKNTHTPRERSPPNFGTNSLMPRRLCGARI